jgi:hypothetical protein
VRLVKFQQTGLPPSGPVFPAVKPAPQGAFRTAFVRAGIVIAATPATTQAKPIQAVGESRSPRTATPIATPIGTRK